MRAHGKLRAAIIAVYLAIGSAFVGFAADSDSIFGVYKNSFLNRDAGGRSFKSEDILELVKVTDRTAYFRIHLEFYNGHICAMAGVAERHGNDLTYRSSDTDSHGNHCVLEIKRSDKALELDEGTSLSTCQELNCGVNGSFKGTSFDLSRRRDIRYMARLLKSREYADALAEYKAHPKP